MRGWSDRLQSQPIKQLAVGFVPGIAVSLLQFAGKLVALSGDDVKFVVGEVLQSHAAPRANGESSGARWWLTHDDESETRGGVGP